MFQKIIFWFIVLLGSVVQAQELETPYKSKKMAPTFDTIHIDSVSINASFFKVLDQNGVPIDAASYEVNFPKALLLFKIAILYYSILDTESDSNLN